MSEANTMEVSRKHSGEISEVTTNPNEVLTYRGKRYRSLVAGILPPPSKDEMEELLESIDEFDWLSMPVIDPDTEPIDIIDGERRLRIAIARDDDIQFVQVKGMPLEKKLRAAVRMNTARRHLTRAVRVELVSFLRDEGWSQRVIAEMLGTSKSTVGRDALEDAPNGAEDETAPPPSPEEVAARQAEVLRLTIEGKTIEQIALLVEPTVSPGVVLADLEYLALQGEVAAADAAEAARKAKVLKLWAIIRGDVEYELCGKTKIVSPKGEQFPLSKAVLASE